MTIVRIVLVVWLVTTVPVLVLLALLGVWGSGMDDTLADIPDPLDPRTSCGRHRRHVYTCRHHHHGVAP